MEALPDPCPLPGSQRRRGLNDRERMLYAPMSQVGGLVFDKDAAYIDIPDWKVGSDLNKLYLLACWAVWMYHEALQLSCAMAGPLKWAPLRRLPEH